MSEQAVDWLVIAICTLNMVMMWTGFYLLNRRFR